MFETYMTIKEAKQAMRLSSVKIYALLNERKMTAIKIGRKTLIPRSSVEAFMSSCPQYKA